MGWEDLRDWASTGSAVVATVFAGLSLWSSRRSKAAETEARNQATRATVAAENAALAQGRLADLAEGRAVTEESKPWEFEPERSGMATLYTLVNKTAMTKYGVVVTGPRVRGGHFGTIDGHDRRRLNLVQMLEVRDPNVVVSWFPNEAQTGAPLTQHAHLT